MTVQGTSGIKDYCGQLMRKIFKFLPFGYGKAELLLLFTP